MELKKADIILVHGDCFISDLIKDVQNSKYSHVAGIVRENEIVEAQGFEITGFEGLHKYIGQADVYRCDSLTDEQRDKIVAYAESQVGSHYDWFLLVWEFIRYKFNIILPYKKKVNVNICSSLWNEAFRSVNVDICPNIIFPSPDDISKSKLLRKIGSI